MLTETQINELFRDYSKRHYLSRLLSKIPLPPLWRAAVGGILAYLAFLVFAALSDWQTVTRSFLHLWQMSFSVTIFFGLWLGSYALDDLRTWLIYIGQALGLKRDDFADLVKDTLNRLESKWSFAFALPFMMAGLGVAITIARNSPNSLFPFPSNSPAFVYSVFVELCIFMLHLLGATGFWLLYIFTLAARMLSRIDSVDYKQIDRNLLKPLSNIVLRLCFYLLVIIASAMPGVAYVVFWFGKYPLALFLGTVFGMALPTMALTLSFFGPVYYLHYMLVKAKDVAISLLKEQIRICEGVLHNQLIGLSTGDSRSDNKSDDLVKLLQFLRERLKETQQESDWPFDFYSLLRLSGSSLLPIVAFFAEQAIRLAFP
ncbi:MAG: hypothetical protein HY872_00895 [Chloroflexi bacterium]|nr:hypothetical protein [Chloroflexota bacterium]